MNGLRRTRTAQAGNEEAERAFDQARDDFKLMIGKITRDDLEVLKRRIERAWEKRVAARAAWKEHIREHRCRQPLDRTNFKLSRNQTSK